MTFYELKFTFQTSLNIYLQKNWIFHAISTIKYFILFSISCNKYIFSILLKKNLSWEFQQRNGRGEVARDTVKIGSTVWVA